MNIKVVRYELHPQTNNSKPFVLYTIQIDNRKKRRKKRDATSDQLNASSSDNNQLLSSTTSIPLNYSSPFDREYKYSYVEEFDDENSTSSSSDNDGGGVGNGGGGASSSKHHQETHHKICEFMEHSDWTVTKRYSEINDYHHRFIELCNNNREIKSLFPKKLIIGNLKRENIEKRIEQFNEYFQKMVEIILSPPIQREEDNGAVAAELEKLVSHFFSNKPPLVSSESNPSKHPNKNIDWMIHKPNSRNSWFFSAPNGFETFSVSFDRRAEYISPIFQNISIETLINIWEMFISKQEKLEVVDSNHDIYLYTYRQKSSFIKDFITVQFIQEIPKPKTTNVAAAADTNTATATAEISSPSDNNKNDVDPMLLDDNLSNMSPPNFDTNVGDILRRFSIRRTTVDFGFRDLLSDDTSNHHFEDIMTQSSTNESSRKPKFSIVLYSRSKIDLKDTNEKRVKAWIEAFKKLVLEQVPTVILCNSFQWE